MGLLFEVLIWHPCPFGQLIIINDGSSWGTKRCREFRSWSRALGRGMLSFQYACLFMHALGVLVAVFVVVLVRGPGILKLASV